MSNDVRKIAERGPITGAGLRLMREALNLTGRELAGLLATNAETISRWQHDDPKPDAWAFVLVGSMVLEQVEGRTTTRDRLTRIRLPGIEEVRRAIVDAVRPLVTEKRDVEDRRASDQRLGRQLLRELALNDTRSREEIEAQWASLSGSERAAIQANDAFEDAEGDAITTYERERIATEDEAREKRLLDALTAIDERFAKNTAAIKTALRTARKNGAPATAARLAWDAGIEERAEGKKWKEVRPTIEARYRKASSPPRRSEPTGTSVAELLANLRARRTRRAT